MRLAVPGKVQVWGIGLVVLLIAVAGALLLNAHSISTGSINISPHDYDQAQRRWAAQHIVLYEIDVEYRSVQGCGLGSDGMMCGVWTLRVDTEEDTVTALAHNYGTTAGSNKRLLDAATGVAAGKEMRYLTVDGLFERVRAIRDKGPFAVRGTLIDYEISFDPDLGHPTRIAAKGRPASDGSWSDMPAHLSSWAVVQQLRVITKR
ncbi:MAG: hypothetical protein ABI670_08830 [Chloroflexota bacterium]